MQGRCVVLFQSICRSSIGNRENRANLRHDCFSTNVKVQECLATVCSNKKSSAFASPREWGGSWPTAAGEARGPSSWRWTCSLSAANLSCWLLSIYRSIPLSLVMSSTTVAKSSCVWTAEIIAVFYGGGRALKNTVVTVLTWINQRCRTAAVVRNEMEMRGFRNFITQDGWDDKNREFWRMEISTRLVGDFNLNPTIAKYQRLCSARSTRCASRYQRKSSG